MKKTAHSLLLAGLLLIPSVIIGADTREIEHSTLESQTPTLISLISKKMGIGLDEAFIEDLKDTLDFETSRGIDLTLSLTKPLQNGDTQEDENEEQIEDEEENELPTFEVIYKARWGYRGAGDRNKPFTGFRGKINMPVSYDGITVDPCKSKKLRKKIYNSCKPLLKVTPVQECFLKLFMLLWSEAQKEESDIPHVSKQIEILGARLAHTPSARGLMINSWPVLGKPGQPGLFYYFMSAPHMFTRQMILMTKKACHLLGLPAAPLTDTRHKPWITQAIEQANFFGAAECRLTIEGLSEGPSTLTIPYGYAGAGNPNEPFKPSVLTITWEMDEAAHSNSYTTQHESVADAIRAAQIKPHTELGMGEDKTVTHTKEIYLEPEKVFLSKLFLLLAESYRTEIPTYKVTEQINTLLLRLAITPNQDKLLYTLCSSYQAVVSYDFTKPLPPFIDEGGFLLQVLRIIYRAYTMNVEKQNNQEIANFVTDQLAHAFRRSTFLIVIKHLISQSSPIKGLRKKGVRLNLAEFLSIVVDKKLTQPKTVTNK